MIRSDIHKKCFSPPFPKAHLRFFFEMPNTHIKSNQLALVVLFLIFFPRSKSVWTCTLQICACCTSTASLYIAEFTRLEMEYRRSKYVSPRLGIALQANATTIQKHAKDVFWLWLHGTSLCCNGLPFFLETCQLDSSMKHFDFLKVDGILRSKLASGFPLSSHSTRGVVAIEELKFQVWTLGGFLRFGSFSVPQ